jgi:hypothetical protein
MLHTNSATEYRVRAERAIPPTIVTGDAVAEESSARHSRLAAEQALDAVLADSFPASDPPSWNPGTALLNPAAGSKRDAKRSEAIAGSLARTGESGLIEVSKPIGADRTFLRGLVSLAGTAGLALLVPFGILLVGLPIALSIRGVVELFGWLFGVNIR